MTVQILFLGIVFVTIFSILAWRKPLYLALLAGMLVTVALYRIDPVTAVKVIALETVSRENITTLLSFYFITLLQKMLVRRNRLKKAQASFDRLIRNRRLNIILSTSVMGLLPSSAIMSVCAEMVDKTGDRYLDNKEKMAVSCYYRHIAEMFVPTFTPVILMLSLTSVNPGMFMLSMIPPAVAACVILYFVYLRKMPEELPPLSKPVSRKTELKSLAKNLWSLAAVVLIIAIFGLPIYFAAPIVIVLDYFIDHFTLKEVPVLLKNAAEVSLLCNIYLVMLFKAVLAEAGAIEALVSFFNGMALSPIVTFALIFFFGTVVSGSQAIIAICIPLVFAVIPDGGVPLCAMLMGISWAAMQISPTHVCTYVAGEYYKTSLNDIIVKLAPSVAAVALFSYCYGIILMHFI